MPKLIDLTGQKFGRLTAIEYIKGSRWQCVCDCGNEKTVSAGNLLSGNTKSCGCLAKEVYRELGRQLGTRPGPRPRSRMDLSGRKFGRLTAIEVAEVLPEWDAWRCQCDCGNKVVASSRILLAGDKKSCGCLKGRTQPKALSGWRFGRLTAIECDGNKGGKPLWRCICDCGSEKAVTAQHLLRGDTKSCGCFRRSTKKERLRTPLPDKQ